MTEKKGRAGYIKYENKVEVPLSQNEAWEKIANRKLPSNIKSVESSAARAALRGAIPAPTSISEMARALRHNVDLIYEWVYSNVDFYCMWGLHKGAFGTLIDQVGGSFEQSALMVALCRESGYTANFVKGSIRLTRTQLENLLATTESDVAHPSEQMISTGNIPYTAVYDVENLLEYIDFDHVWVQVEINGVDYVFDPTYKLFDYTAGIDLATATGFDEGALITAALDGTSSSAFGVKDYNAPNIRSAFATYGTNLLSWIQANAFSAGMIDIIGGRTIQPLSSTPVRQTELPYQTPESEPTIWEDIPNVCRATYQVEFAGIDETFYSDEIYGKRLTITVNGDVEPELKLDGALLATGSAQTPDDFATATFTIEHPFAFPSADQIWQQGIFMSIGSIYFLGNCYAGPCSQAMVDYHRRILQQNIANGGADGDEDVLGESLAVNFYMHFTQTAQFDSIIQQISECTFFRFHFAGLSQYNSFFQGPAFDLAGVLTGIVSNVDDSAATGHAFAASMYYAGALEGGIIQQNLPVKGICAARMITEANEQGQYFYNANLLSWSSVDDLLVNWDSSMAALNFAIMFNEGGVIIHEDGATTFESAQGGGYYTYYYGSMADTMTAHIHGGGPATPATEGQVKTGATSSPPQTQNRGAGENKSSDPVGFFSGSYYYDRQDMTVGSSQFPYSLAFSRSYSSDLQFTDGPLGFGWTHNLATKVSLQSNGLRAIGEVSPKEAAAAIAHCFAMVNLELFFYPAFIDQTKVVIAAIATQWLMDECLTNNAVVLTQGSTSRTFIKLIDGTWNPQPGMMGILTQNMDDTFTLKSPHVMRTISLPSNGQFEQNIFAFLEKEN